MKDRRRNGQRAPRFALMQLRSGSPSYYRAGSGVGTQRQEAQWMADPNHATHWPSRYAAKIERQLVGFDPVEISIYEVA